MPQTQATPTNETEATYQPDSRDNSQDKIAKIAELLRGRGIEPEPAYKIKDGSEPQETVDKTTEAKAKPETKPGSQLETTDKAGPKEAETQTEGLPQDLSALAERLGVKVKDLYSLKVPISVDGETRNLTLGELKDVHDERKARIDSLVDERIKPRELEYLDNKQKHEKAVAQTKQELELLFGALPREALTPAVLAKVKAEVERYNAKESQRLYEIIPEWNDSTIRENDIKAMAAHLEPYGYGEDTLRTMNDSRMFLYIRHNWQREQRMAESLAKVTEVKTVPKATLSSVRPPAPKPGMPKSNASPRERAAHVAKLLNL